MAKLHMRIVILSTSFLLAGCSQVFGYLLGYETLPSYRYRVTVEVKTPEGVRSGSSVFQVDSQRSPGWLPGGYSVGRNLSGDAITIDLRQRGRLFLLLYNGWGKEEMLHFAREYGRYVRGPDKERVMIEHVLSLKGKWNLERHPTYHGFVVDGYQWSDQTPTFLTFVNVRRPSTARLVEADHLDAAFGEGVSLRRIAVEVTNDPVTRTITETLPWVVDENAVSDIRPVGALSKFVPIVTDNGTTIFQPTDFRRIDDRL